VKALLKHLGVDNLTALVAGVSFAGGEPVFESHISLADPRARTILTAALRGVTRATTIAVGAASWTFRATLSL
jgi:hypothetical protein